MSTPTTESTSPPEIKKDANYTPAEAASWLRCERQVVYDLIRDGYLAAKPLTPNGRRYIIPGSALIDYRDHTLPDA